MKTKTASPAPIAAFMDAPPPRGLFARLSRIALHIKRCQEESLRGFDLSYSDYIVLGALRTQGGEKGLYAGQLAKLVLRPKGSITLILDRLEKAELIERVSDVHDRRALLIRLREKGLRVALEVSEAFDQIQLRVLSTLDDDDTGNAEERIERIDHAVRELLEIFDEDERKNSVDDS